MDNTPPNRPHPVRSEEGSRRVWHNDNEESIHYRSQEHVTSWHIDVLRAYKIQLVLEPTICTVTILVDGLLICIQTIHCFRKKMFFSDEAHFYFNGYINKIPIFGVMNKRTNSRATYTVKNCLEWTIPLFDPYFFKIEIGQNYR